MSIHDVMRKETASISNNFNNYNSLNEINKNCFFFYSQKITASQARRKELKKFFAIDGIDAFTKKKYLNRSLLSFFFLFSTRRR